MTKATSSTLDPPQLFVVVANKHTNSTWSKFTVSYVGETNQSIKFNICRILSLFYDANEIRP